MHRYIARLAALAIVLYAVFVSTSAKAQQTYPPILANPKIVQVLWTPAAFGVAAHSITASAVYSWAATSQSATNFLQEYNTLSQTFGRGTFVYGSGQTSTIIVITPANGSTMLYDLNYFANGRLYTDVADELTHQIAIGALPASDANTVYMVHLPPGVSVTTQGNQVSCVAFNGYHFYSEGLVYGVIPDFHDGSPCATGAIQKGLASASEALAQASSHEVMEAITDPQLTAWNGPEIGDSCNPIPSGAGEFYMTQVQPAFGGAVPFQKMWSNFQQVCVSPEPTHVCCFASIGNNQPSNCGGMGAGPGVGDKCAGSGGALVDVPITRGSIYAGTQMAGGTSTTYHYGISAPGSYSWGEYAKVYSTNLQQSAPAAACFDPPTGPIAVYSCKTRQGGLPCPSGWFVNGTRMCCQANASYVNANNQLCGTIPNVLVH